MGTEIDVFREEDLILNQMDQVGRLDRERELDRLINVLNDTLVKHSTFGVEELESIYSKLKRELEREYYKTRVVNLNPTEMKIWHLSMFSSIEFLQKVLVNKGFDQPEGIVQKFNEILDSHFEEQLEFFSSKYDIDDLNRRLPEPEVFFEDNLEVHYWYNMRQERQEFTRDSKNPSWQTESRTGHQEVEVQM